MINDMTPSLLQTVYGLEKPTFSIYQANGQRKPGLKKAFVDIVEIEPNKQDFSMPATIILKDGSSWPVVYEDGIVQSHSYHAGRPLKFIISFQVYTDSRYVAVARLYKDKAHGTK